MPFEFQPRVRVYVEELDATFIFGSVDQAFSRLAAAALALRSETGEDRIDFDQVRELPPGLLTAFSDLVNEGVIAWEGVIDPETKEPVPCTHENVATLPTEAKWHMAAAYLAQHQTLQKKRGSPDELPTD